MNALFLEVHIHIDLSELPCYLDNIEGVSSKSAYGFYDNHVNLALVAETEHFIEFVTFFYASAGDSLVGINAYELPFGFPVDAVGVVLYLIFIAVELVILLG